MVSIGASRTVKANAVALLAGHASCATVRLVRHNKAATCGRAKIEKYMAYGRNLELVVSSVY